jgi:hypothetical protein
MGKIQRAVIVQGLASLPVTSPGVPELLASEIFMKIALPVS